MKLHLLPAAVCLALAGCAGSNTSVSQGAYALTAALDTAEKLAAAYEQSPAANAAVVAQIKMLDARAYAAVAPMAANANNTTLRSTGANNMSIATILALLGVVETLIQDTPQAVALFASVKAMMASGTEPTADQWAALNAQLATDHAALQQG
jgi:hypothetical protein